MGKTFWQRVLTHFSLNLELPTTPFLRPKPGFLFEKSRPFGTSHIRAANRLNRLDTEIPGRIYGFGCPHPDTTTDLRNVSPI